MTPKALIEGRPLVEVVAEAIYEAARQEAAWSCRPIVPEPWPRREEAFRAQFIATIERICQPGYVTTPEAEHDSWVRAYEAMGWTYGLARDRTVKTHPDMVPYAELGEAERQKDAIFLALCMVARPLLDAYTALEQRLEVVVVAAREVAENTIAPTDQDSILWYTLKEALAALDAQGPGGRD